MEFGGVGVVHLYALQRIQVFRVPEKNVVVTIIQELKFKVHITHCVRKVNAADVMLDGSPSPLMTSCQSFLLMTSTRPPRAMTRLYSSYRSNTCLAMMGRRLIGVPRKRGKRENTFLIVWEPECTSRTFFTHGGVWSRDYYSAGKRKTQLPHSAPRQKTLFLLSRISIIASCGLS